MQENQPEAKVKAPRKRFVGRAKRSQIAGGETLAIEDGAVGFASKFCSLGFR